MKISVVIPALNEAACILRTIAHVQMQAGPLEIVVADGGSTDETAALAERAARVVASLTGRALQMNRGAAFASGDVLFFLHADTLLAEGAFAALRSALADPAAEAGTFRLRFDRATPLLRFYSFCTHFRHPWICFGDRGLFVRRRVFEALGGFPETPLFEDLEMARRLYARGGFRFMPQHVTTSARRFEAYGPLRQQLRNTFLWSSYLLGVPPSHLAHLYAYPGARHPGRTEDIANSP